MGLLDPKWNNWSGGGPIGLKGLLAKQFDPKELRYRAGSEALLQAGLGILNRDPYAPPTGIAGMIGKAFSGAAQGARQGRDDFYQDGMMNVQLSEMQRQQDQRDQQKSAMDALIPTLPPDIQSFARAFPDKFAEAYAKVQFGGAKDLQSVSKGASLYDPNTKQWITPPAPGGGAMPADIDDLTKMTKAFEASPGVSRYREVQPMLSSMEKSLSDTSTISDLDFVYGVAKILDPGSVVREKEGQMIIESQSLPASLLGQLNRLANGEQALLPEIRSDLYRLAHRRAGELRLQAEGESRYFTQTGKDYGIKPDQYRRLDPMPNAPTDPLGLRSAVTYGGR